MDNDVLILMNKMNLNCSGIDELNGQMIERDIFLNDLLYDSLKPNIDIMKKYLSSTYLTSLQKTANTSQKWPLLNLVRQILKCYKLKMKPIRKSNGYTPDGKKLYKRFFLILYEN